MKYSIDFKLYGTAYIEAETEEEARGKFVLACGTEKLPETIDLAGDYIQMDNGVDLSPYFTAYGSDDELDLVDD